ncbi:hypothetical protein CDAR_166501 [Caerostris darwini]|uniref:ATP synthase F0 subunit 8 n=1 Tax=Caerostris darwini TaxID=1538125 RepID=A0AAV4VUZ5_9ARAC|nr:hypothetical protein CDAR_166501 [Caerostris darwini]
MGAAKLAVILTFALLTGIWYFCNGLCVRSYCDSILLFPFLIAIQYVLKGQKIKGTAQFNCSYLNDAKNIPPSNKCTSTDDFGDFLSDTKTAELKNVAGSMDENVLLNTNTNMFNVQYITSFVSNPTYNKHSTVDLPFNVNKPFLVDALKKNRQLVF